MLLFGSCTVVNKRFILKTESRQFCSFEAHVCVKRVNNILSVADSSLDRCSLKTTLISHVVSDTTKLAVVDIVFANNCNILCKYLCNTKLIM